MHVELSVLHLHISFLVLHCVNCIVCIVLRVLHCANFSVHIAYVYCIMHIALYVLHYSYRITLIELRILHYEYCIMCIALCVLHKAYCIKHNALHILHYISHFIFLKAYSNLIDQIEKFLQNKFLDWMSGTGCDEMN